MVGSSFSSCSHVENLNHHNMDKVQVVLNKTGMKKRKAWLWLQFV